MNIIIQLAVLAAVLLLHQYKASCIAMPFNTEVKIIATVTSIPKQGKCYQSFSIQPAGESYFYQASYYGCYTLKIKAGGIYQFSGKLGKIKNLNNPGGIDYEKYSRQHNVYAHLSIKQAEFLRENKQLIYCLLREKEKIYHLLKENIRDKPLAEVLAALTLGIKQGITYQIRQWFVLTGTGHLLAISGLHIALVAGFLFAVVLVLCRPFILLLPLINIRSVSLLISLLLVAMYVLLVTPAVPTTRALLMFGFYVYSSMKKRALCFYYQWWLAAFFVVLWSPAMILSPSFWFSFLAVLFIYLISTCFVMNQPKWMQFFTVQWLLSIALLPLSLFYFSQFSLSGLFVNLFAIPAVGFLLLPVSLLVECSLSLHLLLKPLVFLLTISGKFFLTLLSDFSQVKSLVFYHHISVEFMIFIYASLALAIFYRRRLTIAMVISLYLLLLIKFHTIPKGRFQLTMLNVGQGLSVVLQTRHHTLVYDTGPSFPTGGNMVERAVLPYLHFLGMNRIDTLVISHGDDDHGGGVRSLQSYAIVDQLFSSVPEKYLGAQRCIRGQEWQWDGVQFTVLYPDKWHFHLNNNSSCVLKVTGIDRSVLLVGDIEAQAEKNLLALSLHDLSSDILVVPHHGSSTSSTKAFIQAVNPSLALFPYGDHNRYHFPSANVVNSYQKYSKSVIKTSSHGAVLI